MNIPRVLLAQIREYEKHGFKVVDIEFRSGSHVKLTFEGISTPFFVTKNLGCPRALKNNISILRKMKNDANVCAAKTA